MADEYIKREAALEEANGSPFTMSMCLSEQECVGMQRAQAIIAKRIKALPTADVVKVVRCKDCKKYGTPYCAVDLWTTDITMRKATENGFCSFGERREVQDG